VCVNDVGRVFESVNQELLRNIYAPHVVDCFLKFNMNH